MIERDICDEKNEKKKSLKMGGKKKEEESFEKVPTAT